MTRSTEGAELVQRVKQSAENRRQMLARLGQVPHSVLQINRGRLHHSLFHFKHERGKAPTKRAALNGKKRAVVGRAVAAYTGGDDERGDNGLSIMSGELVQFFARYYAQPGAVYLDPFMGQGVRLQVARLEGLHYYGMDICERFCAFIAAVVKRLPPVETSTVHICGDSRDPSGIPDGIGDFCFTSPPYWDLEQYGPEPGQLGTGHTYEEFLEGMREVGAAWLPKFKPGAFVVLNVNDFRQGGRFYAYHADLIGVWQAAGYVLHDTWIIHGLIGGLPKVFAVDFNLKRLAPKVHEYALVFRVPE